MKVYVIFDPETNSYLKNLFSKSVPNWQDAKQYKRLGSAISPSTGAGLLNAERNVPKGQQPNRYHQNRPNLVVHEYTNNVLTQVHSAPPVYYDIVIKNGVATVIPTT